MSESNRLILVAGIAVLLLLGLTTAGGLWIVAERMNTAEAESRAAEQKALAESAQRQLAAQNQALYDLRQNAIQQNATLQNLATELRNELATQNAKIDGMRAIPAPFQLPGGGFVPAPNAPVILGGLVEDALIQRVQPALNGRAWGPEQATGEPNTPTPGDQQTAWASRTQDGQPEWLILEYAEAVSISKVKVYETYNPGALNKVSVFDEKTGQEIKVWEGADPTPIGTPMGVSEIVLAQPRVARKIKIYLDSVHVPGWNEIDAVGIVDDKDKTQWAIKATASSTFAEQQQEVIFTPPTPNPKIEIDQGQF